MFHHLFSTIAALILVTTHMPEPDPGAALLRWTHILFWTALFFFGIALWNRRAMKKPSLRSRLVFAEDGHRRLQIQTVLLLVLFAFFIHILHLPSLLCPDSIARILPFLRDLCTMGFYFLLLSGIWFHAASVMPLNPSEKMNKKFFIREQMGLSLPALLPWLLLAGIHDLLLLLPLPAFRQAFTSSIGQSLYFILLFTAIFFFAPMGIQKFWNCSPLPSGPLRHRIEKVLRHTGTGFRDILVWPLFGGRMLTAGIMGPWSRFRYILVTPALLQHLHPEALEAVIAHEAGHARHNHLFLYGLILTGFILASWAFMDLLYQGLLTGATVFLLPHLTFLPPVSLAIFIGIALTLTFFLFYFRVIFGFFMRNFERQADAFAFCVQGTATHLIHTFEILARMAGQDPEKPNWHHFSLAERIRFLRSCENDRGHVLRQDLRIKKALILYLCLLALMGGGGVYLHFWGGAEKLQMAFSEWGLKAELRKNPENSLLLRYLGDLYQEQGHGKKAREHYEKAFRLDPENTELLNNMAWLCITSPEPAVADPRLGVYLAEKALRIGPEEPHILDTLAEGYLRTGQEEAAVRLGQKALFLQKKKGGDTAYYQQQLERFRDAAR